MPTYDINGYEVEFPHDAYPCQLTYMETVLAALDQSENALLESPTGTGKTLCLLCATLAWRRAFMARNVALLASDDPSVAGAAANALSLHDYKQQQAGIGAPRDPAAARHRATTIIYASRTHSQLAQVVKELRNTSYKVRTTVLGSRSQLCLNERVLKMPGQAGNFACRALMVHKQCRWYTKHRQDSVTQELGGGQTPPAPIDIEELVKVGRGAEVCPYLLSRDLAATADVIFMPYNYLVDSTQRGQLTGVTWDNAVVIIDEAHNIQDACNANASFDLTSAQLLAAISELEAAASLAEADISAGRGGDGVMMLQRAAAGGGALVAGVSGGDRAELLDRLQCGVKVVSALYQRLQEIAAGIGQQQQQQQQQPGGRQPGGSSNNLASEGVAGKGEELLTLLAELDITPASYSGALQQLLVDAIALLTENEIDRGRAVAGRMAASGLAALLSALDIVFASTAPLWEDPVRGITGPCGHRGYRMFVHRGGGGGGGGGRQQQQQQALGGPPPVTLSYWCFIPGVSMASLRALPLRSVLLTSGTLAPLDSFAGQLGLGFRHTLENPHVINPSQVWVGVVPAGPTGAALNASYANRGTDRYRDELGHAIANFARVVPDGLLVFFPAYALLSACIAHWQGSSGAGAGVSSAAGAATIWERITRHKAPVIEPRDPAAFPAALADYAAKLEAPGSGGAVLFAVCRGKVSEGIDFSDKAGRGVVITGLPFPAAFDPHVRLQRQLLDDEARAFASSGGSNGGGGSGDAASLTRGGRPLTGEQWYVQAALRAVNQAMGRVIRHRWDYGAVLLADSRFSQPANARHMSGWLRDQVITHPSFGAAISSLTHFFRDKGDLNAAAEEAAAARAAAALAAGGSSGGGAAAPSAFQLVAGAAGSSGSGGAGGSRPRDRAAERAQRQQQLLAAPRAADVMAILPRSGGSNTSGSQQQLDVRGGGDAGAQQQADKLMPGSQLDDVILGIQPAAAAARTALLAAQQQQQGAGGRAAGSRHGLPPLAVPGGWAGQQQQQQQQQRGGLVSLQYEPERQQQGPPLQQPKRQASKPGLGLAMGLNSSSSSGMAAGQQQQQQQQQQRAPEGDENNIVGPARLIQQHKQRQQQQGPDGPSGGAALPSKAAKEGAPSKPGAKQPLRMGQFLRSWNSTQVEQAQQQQQQQVVDGQQQQQQQVAAASSKQPVPPHQLQPPKQQAQQHQQQPRPPPAQKQQVQQPPPQQQQPPPPQQQQLPSDAKSFFKLLQDSLPGPQMADVKALLTAYRTKRDLTAFADGLIATLGGSSSSGGGGGAGGAPGRHLLVGFATFMPAKDQEWFRALVASTTTSQKQQQQAPQARNPVHAAAAAAAAAARSSGAGHKRPASSTGGHSKGAGPSAAGGAAAAAAAAAGALPGRTKTAGGGSKVQGSAAAAGLAQQAPKRQKMAAPSSAAAAGRQAAGVQAAGGASGSLNSSSWPSGPAAASGLGSSKPQAQAGLPQAGGPPVPCAACGAAPMASAYRAPCGHLACFACWLCLLGTNLRGVGCPRCKRLVRKAQLLAAPFA